MYKGGTLFPDIHGDPFLIDGDLQGSGICITDVEGSSLNVQPKCEVQWVAFRAVEWPEGLGSKRDVAMEELLHDI